MNAAMVLWGLIVLVGFIATQVTGALTEAQAWIAWSIVLFLLTMWVGKSMKGDKSSGAAWMAGTAFALVASLIFAGASLYGYSWVPLSWLMSLWLLVLGAVKWLTMKEASMQAVAAVWIVSAIFFVGAWGANYWAVGGVILGLPGLLHGLWAK